jgi:hypothetical protein
MTKAREHSRISTVLVAVVSLLSVMALLRKRKNSVTQSDLKRLFPSLTTTVPSQSSLPEMGRYWSQRSPILME